MSVTVFRLYAAMAVLAVVLSSPATAQNNPAVGSTFKDCEKCPEMIVVPAGSFMMGSPENEAGRYTNEGPQQKITIAKPFAVGKFEVTFDEYDACVDDGGCQACPTFERLAEIDSACGKNKHPKDNGFGRGKHPVILIGFEQADAYADWLSKKTGKKYHLLSEEQWEYMARAGTTTAYSNGKNTLTAAEANILNVPPGKTEQEALLDAASDSSTKTVGSYKPNAWGIYDVHGNVAEFTADCGVTNTLAGIPLDGSARTDVPAGRGNPKGAAATCNNRVMRGGSWITEPDRTTRSAFRVGAPKEGFNDEGFRIGLDF